MRGGWELSQASRQSLDQWLRRPDVFVVQARDRGLDEETILAAEALLLAARQPATPNAATGAGRHGSSSASTAGVG